MAEERGGVPVAGRQRIVLATGNRGKLAELARILEGLPVELVTMDELGLEGAVEDGDTFEANALIKARAVAEATGLPAISDDSGLEVDALGGAPGVHSARYAGEHGDDAANNAKLLRELAAAPDRSARFVCSAAFVLPDGTEVVVTGTMEGEILTAPRGSGGFGYDPLFLSLGEVRSNAELAPAEKDAISHRGSAFRALREHVETALLEL